MNNNNLIFLSKLLNGIGKNCKIAHFLLVMLFVQFLYNTCSAATFTVLAGQNFNYNFDVVQDIHISSCSSVTVSGTVDWGDGTQSGITSPTMVLQKIYTNSGIYTITRSVDYRTGGGFISDGSFSKIDNFNCFPLNSTLPPSLVGTVASYTTFRVMGTGQPTILYSSH